MGEYKVIFDKNFVKEYRKLDKSLQIEGDKKILRLKQDPKNIGKPLKYFPNLFELRLGNYRIYYVIEESEVKVLLLSVLHKDEQDQYLRQLTRDKIKKILGENP